MSKFTVAYSSLFTQAHHFTPFIKQKNPEIRTQIFINYLDFYNQKGSISKNNERAETRAQQFLGGMIVKGRVILKRLEL